MSTLSLNQMLDIYPSFLLGHRGARGERFENSYLGFEHTHRLSQFSKDKLIGIEFDVQLTKDNKLAVFHDESLLRLFKRQAWVNQSAYNEIKRLTAGPHAIILLDDILPVLSGYKRVELEIKTHHRTHHSELIKALNQTLSQPHFNETALTLTSFDIKLHELMSTHRFLKHFSRGLLVELDERYAKKQANELSCQLPNPDTLDLNMPTSTLQPLNQTANIARRLGCTGVGLYHPLYNDKMMQLFKRANLTTSAWTVNSIDEAKRLVTLGVDYIITDYPTLFLAS